MFDPADFLTFAEACANGNEADRRSSLSRTYYSVFLRARERLTEAGIIRPTGKGEDHKTVIRALKSRDTFVGNAADRLRVLRGQADYDLRVHLTPTQAANAVLIARTIWPKL